MDRIRPVTTFIDFGRLARRPSRALWLRVGFGVILSVGAFSVVGPPRVLGEGSADLEANGGKRALTEWRTSLYGNLLPRRTLFKVYATVGEEIALGSSGVGVGSGDIVVWTPGQISAPLTVALPPPDFTCSASQPGLGAMTTRAQEVAGPTPAAGGYTPCIYTAATTGVYDVALYGPLGGQSDGDGSAGTIAAPVIDATQASGVSMWDITVRSIADPSAPIGGRVFTDYLAQITGGNGAGNRVESTLWAVTNDGFEYQIDLRGLDPNGFILYGNTVGFLNPDGVTPLYHDLVADINPLSAIEGGVTLSPPTGLLFFAPPAADLPSSIVPTPVVPTVNSIVFQGTAGLVGGVPGSVFGTGGNIVFDGNIGGVAHVVIAPNPGGSGGCASAVFDPSLPANRSLVRVVAAGVQNLAWDGKDNSGASMPESWTGNGGSGYCFSATLHAGEYHFPLLDAENSVLGGPTITLLNPPGGACPFASCSTAFFDDRGYVTSSGATVGTVGSVLPGNSPPPPPDFSDSGFDTTSTTIRAYGDNSSGGFGNQKGLDLWTYFPSEDVVGQLYIVPQGASDLSITKTHVGDFTVGVDGVYTLAVRNVGSTSIAGLITVSDTVPTGLNVVSAVGPGWACGTSGQDRDLHGHTGGRPGFRRQPPRHLRDGQPDAGGGPERDQHRDRHERQRYQSRQRLLQQSDRDPGRRRPRHHQDRRDHHGRRRRLDHVHAHRHEQRPEHGQRRDPRRPGRGRPGQDRRGLLRDARPVHERDHAKRGPAPGRHVRPARPRLRPDLPAQRDRRRDRHLGQRGQHRHGQRPDRGHRPGRQQRQRDRHRYGRQYAGSHADADAGGHRQRQRFLGDTAPHRHADHHWLRRFGAELARCSRDLCWPPRRDLLARLPSDEAARRVAGYDARSRSYNRRAQR